LTTIKTGKKIMNYSIMRMTELLKELICIQLELEVEPRTIDVKTLEGIPIAWKQHLYAEMGIIETMTNILY
jgi:hypothetical protein